MQTPRPGVQPQGRTAEACYISCSELHPVGLALPPTILWGEGSPLESILSNIFRERNHLYQDQRNVGGFEFVTDGPRILGEGKLAK